MDAAIDAYGETGFDALSLRAVARSIDVSHAAPAHHFGDKAGLITAIASEGFRLMADRLAASVASIDEPVSALRAMGCAYVDFADDHPAHFHAMFHRGLHRADSDFMAATADAYDWLEVMVEQFQQYGWRPEADTTVLATATWGLIHGLAVLRAEGSTERKHPGATPHDLVEIALELAG